MTNEMKQQILVACDGNKEVADRFIALMEKEAEGKTRCTYPMSEFYTFNEDVPKNTRTSTTDDCEKCDECECDIRHCLITENDGEPDVKEKSCPSHCPSCNGTDIDYCASYSVADAHYHQRCVCLECTCCFIEVSEMVYRSTLLTEERR